MKVLLVGNFSADAQFSMQGFVHALASGLPAYGVVVETIAPTPILSRPFRNVQGGIGKWLGYNGFAESFVSRLWDEFLDGEVLWSVRDAQIRLSGWRKCYNEERLHSRIGYKTPAEFAAAWRGKSAGQQRFSFCTGGLCSRGAQSRRKVKYESANKNDAQETITEEAT